MKIRSLFYLEQGYELLRKPMFLPTNRYSISGDLKNASNLLELELSMR